MPSIEVDAAGVQATGALGTEAACLGCGKPTVMWFDGAPLHVACWWRSTPASRAQAVSGEIREPVKPKEDIASPPVVTRRLKRPWTAHSTAYLLWSTGKGVTDAGTAVEVPRRPKLSALLATLPEDAQQVYLIGAPPGGTNPKFEAWALGEMPDGWSVDPRGHYLDADARDRAALRFRRPDGDAVVLMRVTSWVDDPMMTALQARAAFALLRSGLEAEFGAGAPVLATPATTGRELLLRSLPPKHVFPVLDPELRELLHHTAGQGRFEMFAAPDHHSAGSRFSGPEIPGLFSYDMRFAYAGLCRGALGTGPGLLEDSTEFLGHAPARYRVRFTVPQGWAHLGLLGALDDDGRPWWPSVADGREHHTWVDSRELLMGERHGWLIGRDVHIEARLSFGTSKAEPLRTWADKLTAVRETWLPAQEAEPAVVAIARDMVRAILLQGLGALQGRRAKTTQVLPDERVDEIPRGAGAHEAGRMWVWQTESAPTWGEMVHPEWSTAVWAAQRCRLLDTGPNAAQPNVGALHIPVDQLLAVRADAVYTTVDPAWVDPGKVGQFRRQIAALGPHPTPRSHNELLQMAASIGGGS